MPCDCRGQELEDYVNTRGHFERISTVKTIIAHVRRDLEAMSNELDHIPNIEKVPISNKYEQAIKSARNALLEAYKYLYAETSYEFDSYQKW
jgi:hypothetical protein